MDGIPPVNSGYRRLLASRSLPLSPFCLRASQPPPSLHLVRPCAPAEAQDLLLKIRHCSTARQQHPTSSDSRQPHQEPDSNPGRMGLTPRVQAWVPLGPGCLHTPRTPRQFYSFIQRRCNRPSRGKGRAGAVGPTDPSQDLRSRTRGLLSPGEGHCLRQPRGNPSLCTRFPNATDFL